MALHFRTAVKIAGRSKHGSLDWVREELSRRHISREKLAGLLDPSGDGVVESGELKKALDDGLNLMTVHEPWKRGELEALKGACKEAKVCDVDDLEFDDITWHRIRDHQLLALAKIGERMLLAAPEYASMEELKLHVPGELAWNQPVFDVPIFELHVSRYNVEPMAMHVAGKLRQCCREQSTTP